MCRLTRTDDTLSDSRQATGGRGVSRAFLSLNRGEWCHGRLPPRLVVGSPSGEDPGVPERPPVNPRRPPSSAGGTAPPPRASGVLARSSGLPDASTPRGTRPSDRGSRHAPRAPASRSQTGSGLESLSNVSGPGCSPRGDTGLREVSFPRCPPARGSQRALRTGAEVRALFAGSGPARTGPFGLAGGTPHFPRPPPLQGLPLLPECEPV